MTAFQQSRNKLWQQIVAKMCKDTLRIASWDAGVQWFTATCKEPLLAYCLDDFEFDPLWEEFA